MPAASRGYEVTVAAARLITPHMRRITFTGDDLATFPRIEPAQWLKIVFPGPEGSKAPSRAYTIRRHDPSKRSIEVDFVLHGTSSPASGWATSARPGDPVRLVGPRGGHVIRVGVGWRLLAGDETALPAIATIIERLPAGVPTLVYIEIPNDEEIQDLNGPSGTQFIWLSRRHRSSGAARLAPPGALLSAAVWSRAIPDGVGQVFVAGEARTVREIVQSRPERVARNTVDAKGYWCFGEADHKDRD